MCLLFIINKNNKIYINNQSGSTKLKRASKQK